MTVLGRQVGETYPLSFLQPVYPPLFYLLRMTPLMIVGNDQSISSASPAPTWRTGDNIISNFQSWHMKFSMTRLHALREISCHH